MSVLLINRTESRFEAIVSARNLRKLLRDFMQRDFGVKDFYHLHEITNHYGRDVDERAAKYFFEMDNHKRNVTELSGLISQNLKAAEALYPTNLGEYEKRREYLDNAIVCCNQLNDELMQVITDFCIVDINSFKPVNDAIKREIALIKRWRQRDNKFKSRFNTQGNV